MNEEILGGLRSAIERGESLKKAMMTFYNAGYKKEQIEEAAQFLSQNPTASPVQILQPSVSAEKPKQKTFGIFQQKTPEQKSTLPLQVPANKINSSPIPQAVIPDISKAPKSIQQPAQVVSNYGEQQISQVQPATIQKVSNYGNEDVKDRVAIIILVVVLIFLVGILASVFLFKQEITNFLSGLFS
ncbi:Uncharacterised protein [uncultured archaeon]|nr:Uncharacterised protein [uncultured archaeon]